MTVEPLARVLVLLADIPTVFVPLYTVPLTVTDQFFAAVDEMAPLDVDTSFNAHVTVLVLFAID
jgi:hypothetical protein